MKKGIHPENYRLVAFKDMSNDHVFLCRSAVSTKETIEVNGETYPVYKMEISTTSHPFYTGKMKLVDTAGRVDKFMSRYAKRYDGLFCRNGGPTQKHDVVGHVLERHQTIILRMNTLFHFVVFVFN